VELASIRDPAGATTLGAEASLAGKDGHSITYRVRASDGTGTESVHWATRGAAVDLSPPTVVVASSLPAQVNRNGLRIDWTATDPSGISQNYARIVPEAGGDPVAWAAAGRTVRLPGSAHGVPLVAEVVARDNAGQETIIAVPGLMLPDLKAPRAWLTADATTEGGNVTLGWAAADSGLGVAGVYVDRLEKSGTASRWVSLGLRSASETLTESSLPAGLLVQYRLVPVDAAGNVGAAAMSGSVTIPHVP
jgi:hypothetical protein